ncbi:MAG: hypothetical protein C0506_05560 [Anaerolinea sp.]|nr:hypothetical protein [Anaerolinea sp.]
MMPSRAAGKRRRLQKTLHLPQVLEGDGRDPAALDRLAARVAGGDSAAFEQLYVLLVDDLYMYVRGQCHNETVAEDIVANVFLKAWRSAAGYHAGSDRFRRWIFTIARNEVRDYWRASQRTLPILQMDVLDEAEAAEPGLSPEVRAQVERAMKILTDDQRQVVVLRYFNNKSHEEIARIMGKREGAVRALLLRALRHMRKVMLDAAP